MSHLLSNLSKIIKRVGLTDLQVKNVYNFGSWVHQTNTETSDYDLIIVGDFPQKSKYTPKRYFHSYKLFKLEDLKCDVVLYSQSNFERLLELSYFVAVECVFFPPQFILKNEIDFKKIYLDQYYSVKLIQQSVLNENQYSHNWIYNHPGSSREIQYLNMKKLFNSFKYFEVAMQLLKFKEIKDFGSMAPFFFQMRKMWEESRPIDEIYEPIKSLEAEYLKAISNFKE